MDQPFVYSWPVWYRKNNGRCFHVDSVFYCQFRWGCLSYSATGAQTAPLSPLDFSELAGRYAFRQIIQLIASAGGAMLYLFARSRRLVVFPFGNICLLDMNPTVRRKETPSNKKQFVSNVGILLWHHFAFHPSTVLPLTGHGASWRLFFLVSYNTFSFQQLEFPWHAPRTCT